MGMNRRHDFNIDHVLNLLGKRLFGLINPVSGTGREEAMECVQRKVVIGGCTEKGCD